MAKMLKMKRIYGLIAAVTTKYPEDPFFKDFEKSCMTIEEKRACYKIYENALQELDEQSWQILKDKAVKNFIDLRGKSKKVFNLLNEAFAYSFLVQSGCTGITMLSESSERGVCTPDIQYVESGQIKHCEVKTLGISNEEIDRREKLSVFDGIYSKLGDGFFKKLDNDIKAAKAQVATKGTSGLVYLVVNFDDLALDYYSEYKQQIISYCRDKNIHGLHIHQIDLCRNCHITIPYNYEGDNKENIKK
ncbi:MAG: hypothetical protein FWD70_01890 [Desulfuromonadales bacterium]|nr:hypothetical protein [Desulfuromonadales bacterium]